MKEVKTEYSKGKLSGLFKIERKITKKILYNRGKVYPKDSKQYFYTKGLLNGLSSMLVEVRNEVDRTRRKDEEKCQ